MREVRNVRAEGKHLIAAVQVKDLSEYDILASGSIVSAIFHADTNKYYLYLREQTLDGMAQRADRTWKGDMWVDIIVHYA